MKLWPSLNRVPPIPIYIWGWDLARQQIGIKGGGGPAQLYRREVFMAMDNIEIGGALARQHLCPGGQEN